MKLKLMELATVQMGYSFRSRIEPAENGEIKVIQMKDLSSENTVNRQELIAVDVPNIQEHHLVQKGDLVFRSRGLDSTSAILTEDLGKAIVAAPLIKIRIKNNQIILPEYLNWFIAQKDSQIFFTSRAKGTTQQMISRQAVDDLEVNVPSIDRQKSIVELASLAIKEQYLLEQIAKRKAQYISEVLLKYAKGKE